MFKKLKGFKKSGHAPDYFFIALTIILVIFGIVMLSSASSDLGKIKFNDTYYYLKHQIYYGLSLGILGFLVGSFVNYKNWRLLSVGLLILSIVALALVFTSLGFKSGGANRWINLGPFSFQPAELLKLTYIIYIAAWLGNKKGNRQTSLTEGLLPFLIISGAIAILILMQPATTTIAIILLAGLIVYFVSGAKKSYISLFVIAVLLLAAVFVYSTPYRMQRIMGYLNSESADNLSAGYHRSQALIAIGVGGPTGIGFGQATTKYKFLPEPIGDSIFAVIAEEWGFVGSVIVITLFLLFFWRGLWIAKNCRDKFGRLIVIGFISIISIQTFINIGAISGLLPLTGVSLPFISYGGTSLAIFLTMTGIIVNISKYT